MDKDDAEVKDNPLTGRSALAPARLEAFADKGATEVFRERTDMRHRIAAANQEVVGKYAIIANVKKQDIGCFLLLANHHAAARDFLDVGTDSIFVH